ncbi:hypothetical protein ACFWPQ_33910 [Streptomyces sp. NPDC058464]|uniref:hypothetical protein n=1 Tax=Streptomyces sp. NPDC058464 TaxID=3346511 RepID=UPI0036574537
MQAALGEAERGLQRLVDARATRTEVLAGLPSMVTEPPESAIAGSTVPRRETGMTATVLAPDYQRILSVLDSEASRVGMRCQPGVFCALAVPAVCSRPGGVRPGDRS